MLFFRDGQKIAILSKTAWQKSENKNITKKKVLDDQGKKQPKPIVQPEELKKQSNKCLFWKKISER